MIDDLAPVAVTTNGSLSPANDHGFGKHNKEGLYHYFHKNLLEAYPEVKGTFFILINRHFNHKPETGGYQILSDGFDEDYIKFLHSMKSHFDYAFLGTDHGKIENGSFIQEFEYRTLSDIPLLKEALEEFKKKTGISFQGGKFPGYQSNNQSKEIIEKLGFKWWAYGHEMKNRKHKSNRESYFGENRLVLNFPTNFSGESFNYWLYPGNKKFIKARIAYGYYRNLKLHQHLQYLYENQLIISIQEHFSTLRTDGVRQRPNVFDDMDSLKKIYSILRGADVWYARCDEIARYIENRDNTTLKWNEASLKIGYNGQYEECRISLASKDINQLKNLATNEVTKAFRKNGKWVFSEIIPGEYLAI